MPSTTEAILDVLEDLYAPGALGATFRAMEIAGDVAGDGPSLMFMAMQPSPLLREAQRRLPPERFEQLYRHHCHEIRSRVLNGHTRRRDLELGTWAELVVVLSECSLRAPLTNTARRVYSHAFRLVFGDAVPELPDEPLQAHDLEEVDGWRVRLRSAERGDVAVEYRDAA